jgi:hypothetical protein
MAATDLVPCFYTGQNYYVDPPAQRLMRSEVREMKRQKLGEFRENGKIFLFFKAIIERAKQVWDGVLGRGNALPFSRSTDGRPFHYEIPHANDKGIRRWGFRERSSERDKKLRMRAPIKVSARPQSHLAAQYIQRTQPKATRLADAS